MNARNLRTVGLLLLVAAVCAWLDHLAAAPLGLALAVSFPVIPRTKDALIQMATAPGGPNMSEAVPWMLNDTETYTSTATVELRFFATTKNSRQLSNMETAGQLPTPQFFEAYYQGLDLLVPPSTTAALDSWGDVWALVFGTGTAAQGGPSWTLLMSGKQYGPFPLSTLHGTSGPHGNGYGSTVAGGFIEYGQNSVPDGGWCWNGSLMIPPTVGFNIVCQWPAAVTLTANTALRMNLLGTLHRRIL